MKPTEAAHPEGAAAALSQRWRRARDLAAVVFLTTVLLQTPDGAMAAGGTTVANDSSFPVNGINVQRGPDELVVYMRTPSRTLSPANRWGAEALVVDGTVIEIRDQQATGAPAMPLPERGAVLSGHGAARRWLLANAKPGQTIAYPGQSSHLAPLSPSPDITGPAPGAALTATLAGASRAVAGSDTPRAVDALVVYTRASGAFSPANSWGAEAAVFDGRVIEVSDRQSTQASGTHIPVGGFVLSGHGVSRLWLLQNAQAGVRASLNHRAVPEPTPGPAILDPRTALLRRDVGASSSSANGP